MANIDKIKLNGTTYTIVDSTVPSWARTPSAPTNSSYGQGYGTCNTSNSYTLIVSLSSYSKITGGIISVRFTYDVPAGASLNVNSTGAAGIYHNNSSIASGVIKAGDTATFMYDGSYYRLISIDRNSYNKSEIDTKIGDIETLLASI